jgi:hypothetical protein
MGGKLDREVYSGYQVRSYHPSRLATCHFVDRAFLDREKDNPRINTKGQAVHRCPIVVRVLPDLLSVPPLVAKSKVTPVGFMCRR